MSDTPSTSLDQEGKDEDRNQPPQRGRRIAVEEGRDSGSRRRAPTPSSSSSSASKAAAAGPVDDSATIGAEGAGLGTARSDINDDSASVASGGGAGGNKSRKSRSRPMDAPPPEAFGLLPQGMTVSADTSASATTGRKDRSKSRPKPPGEAPPPEAFGLLPENMVIGTGTTTTAANNNRAPRSSSAKPTLASDDTTSSSSALKDTSSTTAAAGSLSINNSIDPASFAAPVAAVIMPDESKHTDDDNVDEVNPPSSALLLPVASSTKPPRQRSKSRPHRPEKPPPPEAFGLLPEGMVVAIEAPSSATDSIIHSSPPRVLDSMLSSSSAAATTTTTAAAETPPQLLSRPLPEAPAPQVEEPVHIPGSSPATMHFTPHRPLPPGPPPPLESKEQDEQDNADAVRAASLLRDLEERKQQEAAAEQDFAAELLRLQAEEAARLASYDPLSDAYALATAAKERAAAAAAAAAEALAQTRSKEAAEQAIEDEKAAAAELMAAMEKELRDREAEEREKAEAAARTEMLHKKRKTIGPSVPPSAPPKVVPIDTNLIPRGRLEVIIDRVVGVGPGTGGMGGRITSITKGSVYIILELNLGKSRVQARSSVYKNVVMSDFEPTDGVMPLMVTEGVPAPIVPPDMPEDDKNQLPPLLFYSVWQAGGVMAHGDLIAEGVVPASGLFLVPKGPKDIEGIRAAAEGIDVDLPLRGPRVKGVIPKSSANVYAYMRARVKFVMAKCGILCVTLNEGRNLTNMDLGKRQDPFVEIKLGHTVLKSQTIDFGGSNPVFNDEEMFLWIDHAQSVSNDPLSISVFDADTFMRNDLVGSTAFRLDDWLRNVDKHEERLAIADAKGKPAGELMISRQFFPAGELTVKICEGSNIASGDIGGGNDSYVKLSLVGRVKSYVNTTAVDSVSGENPKWNETFVFDVVDHAELHISLMDKDRFTKDDVVGEVTVDLVGVFRHGIRDAWVPVKRMTDWGGFEDKGNLRLEVDFWGPSGIEFPQIRPDIPTFDEKERRSRRGPSAAQQEAAAKARGAVDAKVAAEREQAMKELMGGEFTDQEIQQAFDFIDLDKNLVIGASEIRHILTCMGELITDKEIDAMIKLCDHDGDGQVAFFEFYQMAKAANPGDPKWRPTTEKIVSDKRSGVDPNKPKPPPVVVYDEWGTPIDVIDASDDAEARRKAMLRATEMAKKMEKKRLCEELVEKLELRLPELQRCFKRFRDMPAFKQKGLATFDEMCTILDVETDSEFRDVFAVFSDIRAGKVNIRELLLALNNFTGCTKPQRVNFCFFLFDEDQSGEISVDEIAQIMKASHLAADEEAVRKKAASVLANADHDGSGTISLEEFIVIANRFPAVIFPNYNTSDEDAMKGRVGGALGAGGGAKRPMSKKKKKEDSDEED